MASINLYLDIRKKRADGTSAIKVRICQNGKKQYIPTKIHVNPKVWDSSTGTVIKSAPRARQINAALERMLYDAKSAYLEIVGNGEKLDINDIKQHITLALFPGEDVKTDKSLIIPAMEKFISLKSPSTALTYQRTLTNIRKYEPEADKLHFDDITPSWLLAFDADMAKRAPSPNSRAIHMRNLRAVFNFAIDEGLTSNYPFRRFKIKTVKTAKRNLSAEDLRKLYNMEVEAWQQPYKDFFFLSLFLIGINAKDLLHLPNGSDKQGRIIFNRAKTARLYSIKVEKEAREIIDKYRGEDYMLRFMDERTDYLQFIRQCNHGLQMIGTQSRKGCKPTGEALFPGLTTYWARHSWATIARSIGISIDDIALALGHGDGHDLSHIYIEEQQELVDVANRKVIDYILYGVV